MSNRWSSLTKAEYDKQWRAQNPEKWAAINRRAKLKKKYGISTEQYDEMLRRQQGVCAVCGEVNPDGRRLAVDHEHETGQVRGLLCTMCNRGIGSMRDDPERLRAAAAYLEGYEDIEPVVEPS